MLTISDLSLRIAGRLLLDGASLSLPAGAKAGLVGRNGTGKTTLFRAITGELAPEKGGISLPKNTRIGQVAQEAPGTEEALIDIVLAADDDGRVNWPLRPGNGLTGMQERIAALGGSLDAAPSGHGGLRLVARLPLEPLP